MRTATCIKLTARVLQFFKADERYKIITKHLQSTMNFNLIDRSQATV